MRIMNSGSLSKKVDLGNGMRNKIRILTVEMKEEMKQDAIDVAIEAFEEYIEKVDIATHIRTCFEKKHGGIWHCIVGNNIGVSLNANRDHFIYLVVDVQPVQVVVLFKYGGAITHHISSEG